MADQSKNKIITLGISWKNHFLGYALSVLFIPLFGIGLLGLYWVYKRQKRITYRVSDTQISSRDSQYQRNVDLVNIEKVEVHQNWLQEKLNVGDLNLHTSATSMTLYGMENPYNLKGLLERAIAEQKKLQQQQEQTKAHETDAKPGTKDRMDYLTGLWQQGLVSNEEFEKERKHFE
jgi:hypothetical protein